MLSKVIKLVTFNNLKYAEKYQFSKKNVGRLKNDYFYWQQYVNKKFNLETKGIACYFVVFVYPAARYNVILIFFYYYFTTLISNKTP